MQNAVGLATIFGPFMVIHGLWLLFYQANVSKIMASIRNTPATFYCAALVNLLLGLTIISQFNIWTPSLPLFVTLLGWWLIVRGIFSLFVPQAFLKIMMSSPNSSRIGGVLTLIWGLLLCWLAFWV